MISQIIEGALRSASPSFITDLVIVVISFIFIFSIIWLKQEKHSKFTNNAPNIFASLGILGTFVGIVVGLLDFNTNDIDGSIAFLLEGLKVAFLTSLVGIFASILFKLITSSNILTNKKSLTKDPDTIGVRELYEIMSSQNENIIKLQKLLSENDESSLTGQIKLMRSDISDNNKVLARKLEPLDLLENINQNISSTYASMTQIQSNLSAQSEYFESFTNTLWIKLQDFADMLSKSATEQVINALKEVISDFNNKLTEQFGENFKELNKAVGELVTWQENYKSQLSDMKVQFDASVVSMADMEKSIETISTNSKSIPDSMNYLKDVITINQHQIDELGNHLEAFKDIKDRAVEAVPEIRNQIDMTVKGIHEASEVLIANVTQGSEKMSQAMVQGAEEFANNVSQTNAALIDSSDTLSKSSIEVKELMEAMLLDIDKNIRAIIQNLMDNSKEINKEFKDVGTTLLNEFSTTNKDMQSSIGELANTMQKNIEGLMQEQMKQVQKVHEGLESTIEKSLQKTGDSVQNQVKVMDEVAGKEIKNIMEAMGTALARITGQFSNDYQMLVAEMKKITEAHR